MRTFKIIVSLLCVVVVAAAAVYIVHSVRSGNDGPVKASPSKIAEISRVADLCTVEIYSDIPIKGRIGKKHIFARQTLSGNISFPIDSLSFRDSNDTTFVWLPKEKITLLESTDPKSFEIIDTWNDSFLGSGHFSAAEENSIKLKARSRAIERLYADGTVGRARREAVGRLQTMLHAIWQTPVVVIDTLPVSTK